MEIRDHLIYMIGVNKRATRGFLNDITEDESMDKIDGRFNHVRWLAGHMLYSMSEVLSMLDQENTDYKKYKPKFVGGTEVSDDHSEYPAFSELKEKLDKTYDNILAALENATDDDLEREIGEGEGKEPLWKSITFLSMHDFYHSGQVMYHRRGVGRKWPFG